MITIENLTVHINQLSLEQNDSLFSESSSTVRDKLVNTLRIISKDSKFAGQTLIIPDECEKCGFVEGEFDLPKLLEFLADMLE